MTFQSKTETLKSRINLFNLMRLVLAFTVIFSHSYPLLQGMTVFDPVERLLRGQKDLPGDHPIDLGHLAVYGFFIISGYLVTMSWQSAHSLQKYVTNRVLRICPGFVAVVLICALMFGPFAAVHPETYYHDLLEGKKAFLMGLLLLKGVWTPPLRCGVINGSLWTISYEVSCYWMVAIFGSLAVLSRRRVPEEFRRAAPALLFAVTYILYCLHCGGQLLGTFGLMNGHLQQLETSHWGRRAIFVSEIAGDPVTWSRQFVYFAGGMCLYLYRDLLLNNRYLVWLSVIVVLTTALLLPVLAYTLPIFGSYALITLCLTPNRWLARVGQKTDLSYGVYLYAFPVQQLLVLHWSKSLTPLTLFLLALPCTCLLAMMSWRWVEQPFLKRKIQLRQANKGAKQTAMESYTEAEGLQQERDQRRIEAHTETTTNNAPSPVP